ncbi:Hypothetical predicted protein [Octopus vulgaris]|uniref:Uncharacterized protein n=1 Tax=Octopus vulgaris TaxID=6645 RepID=A0AA36FES4_OCTVU|nr:Hypothetical predicted protein [Octopus vulgaris]
MKGSCGCSIGVGSCSSVDGRTGISSTGAGYSFCGSIGDSFSGSPEVGRCVNGNVGVSVGSSVGGSGCRSEC